VASYRNIAMSWGKGVGRFGWVTDPEGNRVELWQPA
jgi:predicted enzyme related to lactoylglutathione lyase